jgi:hypothetical protein
MSGDIEEALALDDATLLDEVKPLSPEGRFRLDGATLWARHDGQVRAALKDGRFALVILGGVHDLTDSLQGAYGGDLRIRADHDNALQRLRRGGVSAARTADLELSTSRR